MEQLGSLTEQLASAVVTADPSDLPALAQVHEQLQALGQLLSDGAAPDPVQCANLRRTAGGAVELIERIILQDVTDAAAALADVGRAVTELQNLLAGGEPSSFSFDAPDAPALPPAAPAAAHEAGAYVAAAVEADVPVNPDDVPLVHEFITESLSHIEAAEAAVLQLEENPQDSEVLNALFRSFHTIKGVAGFLNLKQIGALAHAAESLLDLARNDKLRMEGGVVDVVLQSIDLLKAMIASLAEAVKENAAPAVQPGLAALLHRLHDAAAGKPSTPSGESRASSEAAAPEAAGDPFAAAPEAASSPKASSSRSGSGEATVKVATDRLDSLINMVGELVIAQSMAAQDIGAVAADNPRLTRNLGHLGKITRELQDLSMGLRMVPIQGVFQKMARLARDTARKACKEVEFSAVGGDTEVDRNVVEAISDPLVHMVRNSVDHGVEHAEDRVAAGKPRTGRVTLRASHQAGNIVIQITDDGRGLHKERILKKAVAAGLVREGQELSDPEIFRLIFHPGLSTAEKLTDISGRGVGMDVVKRNIEALRGRIEIESTPGKGSVFTIRLPLTLAVIDGLVVRIGAQRYILPITSVEQSLRPQAQQISTVQSRGEMCMVRGSLLPLVRLHRLFTITPRTEDPTQAIVVIVQDGDRRCCLMVDELLGQQQVVIKSLGDSIGQVPGVSGGAILGDGNVSLILDIPGLLHIATGR